MSEFDPDAHLILTSTDGTEYRMDRDTSALFTHLGNLALYDHIFVRVDEEPENTMGAYIFRHSPVFEGLAAFMVAEDFPMHLNMTEVAQCDMDAFDRAITEEVPGEIPDDWF